jgi:hypothetical protein
VFGVIVDGLRNGQGKWYYASGSIYDGSWCDNKRHGAGHMHVASGGKSCEFTRFNLLLFALLLRRSVLLLLFLFAVLLLSPFC